jgi:hypothetical protein
MDITQPDFSGLLSQNPVKFRYVYYDYLKFDVSEEEERQEKNRASKKSTRSFGEKGIML